MKWNNVATTLPEFGEEVLVWVDGHRGPSWRNNYALVAYLNEHDKEWYEERHNQKPIVGVIKWAKIEIPTNDTK